MTAPDLCPLCGADLTGEPIPEEYIALAGSTTHYTRRLVVVDPDLDRIVAYECPNCQGTWPVEGQQK